MPHELIHYTNLAVVILRGDNIIFKIHSSSPWKVIGKLKGMLVPRFIKEGMKLNKWLTPRVLLWGEWIFSKTILLNKPKNVHFTKYFLKSMNPTLQFNWHIMYVVIVRGFLSFLYQC